MNVMKEVVACVVFCVNEEKKASDSAIFIGGRDQRFVRPQLFLLAGLCEASDFDSRSIVPKPPMCGAVVVITAGKTQPPFTKSRSQTLVFCGQR